MLVHMTILILYLNFLQAVPVTRNNQCRCILFIKYKPIIFCEEQGCQCKRKLDVQTRIRHQLITNLSKIREKNAMCLKGPIGKTERFYIKSAVFQRTSGTSLSKMLLKRLSR